MFIDPDGMEVKLGGGQYGGDLYTGQDAQDLFRELQAQSSSNNQDPQDDKKKGDDKDKNKKKNNDDSKKADDGKKKEIVEDIVPEETSIAAQVFYGGMTLSYEMCLADGPEPGPGDAAGIIYATATVATASILWAANEIYQFAAEHTSNKSKARWQKHSDTRSGGDLKNGRYGKERNAQRGNKNKKYVPNSNPNKRPKTNQ